MPIAAIRSDESLDQLIGRVHGKLPAAQLTAVRNATLAANPHLSVSAPPKLGTVVVVPSLPGGAAPSSRAGSLASGDALKALDTALSSYRDELGPKVDARRAELTETAKTLKSAKFKRVVEAIPAAADLVTSLEDAVKAEQADATDSSEFVRKDLDALAGNLQKLLAQLP